MAGCKPHTRCRWAAAAAVVLAAAACASTAAAAPVDCTKTPQLAACANFRLPAAAAKADLSAVCKALPQLTACSFARACAVAPPASVSSAPGACDPFQLLATACGRDPLGRALPACRASYGALCGPGSAVKQCQQQPGLTVMATSDARTLVGSICFEMETMDGCERCPLIGKGLGGPRCDPFAVLGWLCGQMPDMTQCIGAGRWDEMCKRDPKMFACVGNAPALTAKGWDRV